MNPASCPDIGIVLLAAGASTRLGRPKQLERFRGQSLLRRAAECALSLTGAPVCVVLGAQADQLRLELDGLALTMAENADWASGMAGSIRTGLQALTASAPGLRAVLLLVCDQPFLSPDVLRALILTHERTGLPAVAAAYSGTTGVPALFHHSLFPDLCALRGAEGARHLLRARGAALAAVPFPDGAVDIDTPDDCARLVPASPEPTLTAS